MTWLASCWQHAGDDLATMTTVNSEMIVGAQNDRVGVRFGHSDNACVGKAHWNVCVLLHERQYGV
jgi:hypothetical protein